MRALVLDGVEKPLAWNIYVCYQIGQNYIDVYFEFVKMRNDGNWVGKFKNRVFDSLNLSNLCYVFKNLIKLNMANNKV